MSGYHTRRARPEEIVDDPEQIAIREALAFGKALYEIRTAGHDPGSVWFETHAG